MFKGRHFLALILLSSALLSSGLNASAGDAFSDAKRMYDRADFKAAIARLEAANRDRQDAPGLRLLGQSYLMSGDPKRATEALEKSIQIDPGSSDGFLWLGRAYGRRAETAFPIAAPSFASKARVNLEKAVQLDAHNWDAVDDLFDYYLEAPGFLGGGTEKAARVAEAIAAHDAAQGCFARARIAESRKQYDQAELQFRKAVELAPTQVSRLVALARFLSKRGRYDESDRTFSKALAQKPDSPAVVWGRARTLIDANRNLSEARELLKRYQTLNLSPDDPTRDDAARLLRKVSGS